MSDVVITAIITSSVSLVGVITGFIATILYNKKRFEKLATNEIKHVELDPSGETMQTINAKFAQSDARAEKIEAKITGLVHHSVELNGILKDQSILSNEQTARLNNHLDNA